MIRTFITSLKLNNTCKLNKTINSIKKFSKSANDVTFDLYSSKPLKVIAGIINFIKRTAVLFFGKILLIYIIYAMIESVASEAGTLSRGGCTLLHVLFFLGIIECFAQSNLLDDGEDKYYAIISIRVDAKKYILVNYYWKMFLRIISFIPSLILIREFIGLTILDCVLYPIFTVMLKTFFNYLRILNFVKNKNTMTLLLAPVSIVCGVTAFVPPVFNITINETFFVVSFVIISILGIYSFYKMNKFDQYYKMYKNYLMPESQEISEKMSAFNIRKTHKYNVKRTVVNKEGFKYFNSLFALRHIKKILGSTIVGSIFIVIELAFMVIISLNKSEIMAVLSAGSNTQNMGGFRDLFTVSRINTVIGAMVGFEMLTGLLSMITEFFQSSDFAMLKYKQFRTLDSIKKLFLERWKLLIEMYIPQALLVGIGTCILIKLNNLANSNLEYVLVLIYNVLFVVNITLKELFNYYIFQPLRYNEFTKSAINDRTFVQMLDMLSCLAITTFPAIIFPSVIKLAIFWIVFTVFNVLIRFIILKKCVVSTFKINE